MQAPGQPHIQLGLSIEVWPRNLQSKVSFTLCSVYPLLPEPAQASSGSSRSFHLRWARLGNTLTPRSDCVVWAISAMQWDLGSPTPTAPSNSSNIGLSQVWCSGIPGGSHLLVTELHANPSVGSGGIRSWGVKSGQALPLSHPFPEGRYSWFTGGVATEADTMTRTPLAGRKLETPELDQ